MTPISSWSFGSDPILEYG